MFAQVIPNVLENVGTELAAAWPLILAAVFVATVSWRARAWQESRHDDVTELRKTVEQIAAQFFPNGGSSMRDKQDQIIGLLDNLTVRSIKHSTTLDVIWQTAPEAFYVTNAEGQVVAANDAYLDLWHFTSMDQAMTNEWLLKLTPAAKELALQRLEQVMTTPYEFAFPTELADGRTLTIVGKPMFNGDEFLGFLGTVYDDTPFEV